MNKWLKSGLFLLLTANMFLFAKDNKKEASVLDRPAFDNKVQFLVPGTNRVVPNNEVIRRIGKKAFEETDTDLSIIPLDDRRYVNSGNNNLVDRDDLWPLSHVPLSHNAEYYLGSGAAGDTFSVVLTPAAPAVVTEVYYQFMDAGNCVAFGSDYGAASALSPTGDCYSIAGGSTNLSPVGQLRTTPTPNTIAAQISDWSTELDIGGTFIVGDSTDLSSVPPFVISYVKGGETPHPLAAATASLGVTTSFTWFGGPWNATDPGLWGRYSSQIENMVMVKVTYPWGAPMSILSLSKPPNTFAAATTVTIEADLLDDIGDNGMGIDANDVLTYYYIDAAGDTTTGSLAATSAVGADGNGIYSFDITYTGAEAGDEITYWVSIVDDTDLASVSEPQSFSIKAPNNPEADLLIVLDRINDSQLNLFETVASEDDVVFEVWDALAEGGIDASVISYGWDNIIVYGWGTRTVPMFAADEDPGYGTFINGGGNLILVDMDWMCASSAGCGSVDFTFASGDFAYDYFGIASGQNDPGPIDTVEVSGLGITDMDTPFVTSPMVLRHNLYIGGSLGWIDYVTAGAGTGIFMDDDGNGCGVMMDHSSSSGGKAVYLSFMADAAGDTAADGSWDYTQFSTFAAGVFTEFGITSPPLIGAVTGQTLSTASASAFPVTAAIVDADADAITATLYYRGSGDASWTSASMTGTAGTFSADIPAVDSTGVISWYIDASDGTAATTYPDNNTPAMSFLHHQPTTGVDVLYVDDSGYAAYFGSPSASIAGTYDSYAGWYYGATDGTIWAAYDHIVWNTDYSGGTLWSWTTATHELATFMSGGGNVLLIGDEPLYAAGIGGSPIESGFAAGMAAFDWFGLSSAWADGYDYRPEYFTSVAGDALTTDLADTVVYANPMGSSFDWTDQLCVGDFSYDEFTVTEIDTVATATSVADTVETWVPGEGVWEVVTTTTTTITTVTTETNDTLSIEQSAWYATRNNNSTSKAIWLPFYYTGLDSATKVDLMANVFTYFNNASAPTGAAGFFGPELGDILETDSETSVTADTVVTVTTDSTNLGVDIAGVPHEFAIRGNYPNPFNPETSIMFSLDITSPIEVKIYSILGQEISTLHSGVLENGYHSMVWNGTDQFGQSVGSGIYIYRITSGKRALTGKMMLLK